MAKGGFLDSYPALPAPAVASSTLGPRTGAGAHTLNCPSHCGVRLSPFGASRMAALDLNVLPSLFRASGTWRLCLRACLLTVEIAVALACGIALGQDTRSGLKTIPLQLVRVVVDKNDYLQVGMPRWHAPEGYHIENFRFKVLSSHGKVSYSGQIDGSELVVQWSVAPQKEWFLGFEVNSEAGVLQLDADVDIVPDVRAPTTATFEKVPTFAKATTEQNSSGSYPVIEVVAIVVTVIGVIVAVLAWQYRNEKGNLKQNGSRSYTVIEIVALIVTVIGVIVAILAWQYPKTPS